MSGLFYVILFGMVFFGIGAGLTYRQRILEGQGGLAQGEVTSFDTSCDDDGCTYKPIVHFKIKSGADISFTSTYSSNPPAYDVGESVQVIYSLENPKKAVIKGEGQVFRIIFMIVGGGVITFGLSLFASNIRNAFVK